jgi:hypothetical protein
MMDMSRRSAGAPHATHAHDVFVPVHAAESRSVATTAPDRPLASLAERVRTFLDRTLDAAFGRFDH